MEGTGTFPPALREQERLFTLAGSTRRLRAGLCRPFSHGVAILLATDALHQRGDVFSPPDGCARAELYGFGIAPGTAAIPPRAFANGEDGEDLRQAEKAGCGNGGEHTKAPFANIRLQDNKKRFPGHCGTKKRIGLLQKKRVACFRLE